LYLYISQWNIDSGVVGAVGIHCEQALNHWTHPHSLPTYIVHALDVFICPVAVGVCVFLSSSQDASPNSIHSFSDW
jgi:hypothetical protein